MESCYRVFPLGVKLPSFLRRAKLLVVRIDDIPTVAVHMPSGTLPVLVRLHCGYPRLHRPQRLTTGQNKSNSAQVGDVDGNKIPLTSSKGHAPAPSSSSRSRATECFLLGSSSRAFLVGSSFRLSGSVTFPPWPCICRPERCPYCKVLFVPRPLAARDWRPLTEPCDLELFCRFKGPAHENSGIASVAPDQSTDAVLRGHVNDLASH